MGMAEGNSLRECSRSHGTGCSFSGLRQRRGARARNADALEVCAWTAVEVGVKMIKGRKSQPAKSQESRLLTYCLLIGSRSQGFSGVHEVLRSSQCKIVFLDR